MLLTITSLTLAIGLVVSTGLLPLPALGRVQDAREAQVDEVFSEFSAPDSPGCAVGIMREGDLVYARGYGAANLEYAVPITQSSVFHVASLSKQFTAMAVALLVSDGLVSWEDDIRGYVPEVPEFDGTPITLRQLAHHTSGLRDQWSLVRMAGWRWQQDVVTQSDVLDLTTRQRALNFIPGSAFLYSNTGYTLLAEVVERVSGLPFRRFTRQRIFGPLGMRDTRFRDDDREIVPNRVYAYARDDEGHYRLSIPNFETVGATSLFTTVRDLARWDENFYTGRVGGPAAFVTLHEPGTLRDGRPLSYAAGLAYGRYRGHTTVGHGGADAGYRAEYLRFPDEHLSITVLCNVPTSNPDRLVRSVADVYLAPVGADDAVSAADSSKAARSAPPSATLDNGASTRDLPKTDQTLTSLEGFYRRADSDIPLHLVVRNGTLTVLSGDVVGSLVQVDVDKFQLVGSSNVGTFERAGDDGATTLRLSGPAGGLYTRHPVWRPTTHELARFIGDYFSADLGTGYTVSLHRGRLVAWHPKLGDLTLIPTYQNGFFSAGFYVSFTGSGERFTMSTLRAWKVRFDRQP